MGLGVRMRSDRKSTITSMVKRGNMGGSVSSNPNKFKRKGSINSDEFKEKDRTDNIKSRDVKLRNNMNEVYSRPSNVRERVDSDRKNFSERNVRRRPIDSDRKTFSERNVRRRPIDSDRKTFSERNVRRKPTSSNGLGFHENNLRTMKKFHNRDYDKDTRGRFDRNSKDSRGDFDSRNQNLRRRVDSRREISNQEEDDGKNESEIQNPKPKFLRSPSRVLLKTGKKVRVNRRELEKGSVVKIAQKKKKKGIKLDPCDESNKRIDDIPLPIEDPEKKAEMSKNAKFRSIIPTTSILSFVEDNLLGRRRLNELTNAGFNAKISSPLDDIPFSTSNERDRIEDPVFRNKLEFFAAAKVSSSFPPLVLPEIAFAGRSNVGKSSLLNSLTRQWGVARTSDKPGLTQTINFFRLASKLSLVDLPGYGFAYAKVEVKDSWEELVKEYVSTRVGLERVCLLVDTKWGMKPRDHELVDLMERSQTPYQIVLTKTDIVFPIDVARRAMEIQESLKKHKSVINPVMMVSSKTGGGIRNLRTVLAKLSRFVKP